MMTTEEKARAYDEALERAKEWKEKYDSIISSDGTMAKDFDSIFPQLRESEDERARKEIVDYFKKEREYLLNDFRDKEDEKQLSFYNRALAYLEKQKEQPTNEEMREHIIDIIKDNAKLKCIPCDAEITYLEKHKESLHISETCKENANSFTYESEDERVRKEIVSIVKAYRENCIDEGTHRFDDCLSWLEKHKESLHISEICKENGDSFTYKQKPAECDKETDIQKAFREGQNAGRQEVFDHPGAYGLEKIDNVFGFRIGDKVRLVDGDGRPHIIKYFEKIEGVHGPDFYRAVFEDNTTSDHIIPGDEYPNGYFTCMEKIDGQEEQKPSKVDFRSAVKNVMNLYKIKKDFTEEDYDFHANELYELMKQKLAEWSEEDEKMIDTIVSVLGQYMNYKTVSGTDSGYVTPKYSKEIDWLKSLRPSWKPSEQEKGALRTAIHILTDERNFPKAAKQLQNILDAFEGKESRKDWKPSEEQIKALGNCFYDGEGCPDEDELRSLYNDLKKLK